MAKTEDAIFRYGADKVFMLPHNPDNKRASYNNMVGSGSAMDFSSAVAPAAVAGIIRVDGGDEIDFVADLDDALIDIDAVTPAQWAAAVTAGLAAHSPAITGYTASVDASGRCKFVKTAAPTFCVEVYGELFTLAGFGQGKGVKFFVSDEMESATPSPVMKEKKDDTVTNAKGIDTTVSVPGYKKGFDIDIVDLPEDFNILSLLEGGTIDATTGAYHEPTPEQSKAAPTFELMVLRRNYNQGENKEADYIGNELITYYSCKGSVSSGGMSAGFDKTTYKISCTNYINSSGVQQGSGERRNLSKSTDAAIIAVLEAI